jgi:hypothetical protein
MSDQTLGQVNITPGIWANCEINPDEVWKSLRSHARKISDKNNLLLSLCTSKAGKEYRILTIQQQKKTFVFLPDEYIVSSG